MTPIHSQIDRLVSDGLHPSAISICRDGDTWTSRVSCCDYIPGEEAGDNLPHHIISFDRSKLPPGVTVGWDMARWPDDVIALTPMSNEQAEAMIAAIAKYGLAPDWATFSAPGQRPHHWLTKPIKWLPEPIRTALLKKHGHT